MSDQNEMPNAPDAERAVLASILIDQKLPDIPIDRSVFLTISHREIFKAIQELAEIGNPIDVIQVAEKLRQNGVYDEVGGHAALTDLAGFAMRADVKSAINTLNDIAAKRRLWVIGNRLVDKSLNGAGSADIISQLRESIRDIEEQINPDAEIGPAGFRPLIDISQQKSLAPLTDDMLPACIAGFARGFATEHYAPLGAIVTPIIISAATMLGSKVQIKPHGRYDWWAKAPNLYGLIIAPSGTRKSTLLKTGMSGIYDAIKKEKHALAERMDKWNRDEIEREMNREKCKGLKKEALRNGNAELAQSLDEQIRGFTVDAPTMRRYLVEDATLEALHDIILENPRGVILYKEEVNDWMRGLEFDPQRGRERDAFKKLWDGDTPWLLDRILRGKNLIAYHATLSVLGAIQKGPLDEIVNKAKEPGRSEDGFLVRFQLLFNEEYPDVPDNPPAKCPPEYWSRYMQTLERLNQIDAANCPFQAESGDYGYFVFADSVQDRVEMWMHNRMKKSRAVSKGGQTYKGIHSAIISKQCSLMPSLALIFHALNCADPRNEAYWPLDGKLPPIPAEWVELAIRWCDLLLDHAESIFKIETTDYDEMAMFLARKIKERRLPECFKARDVQRKRWPGLVNAETTYMTLDHLADMGWLRKDVESNKSNNKKPSVVFYCNPEIEIM